MDVSPNQDGRDAIARQPAPFAAMSTCERPRSTPIPSTMWRGRGPAWAAISTGERANEGEAWCPAGIPLSASARPGLLAVARLALQLAYSPLLAVSLTSTVIRPVANARAEAAADLQGPNQILERARRVGASSVGLSIWSAAAACWLSVAGIAVMRLKTLGVMADRCDTAKYVVGRRQVGSVAPVYPIRWTR